MTVAGARQSGFLQSVVEHPLGGADFADAVVRQDGHIVHQLAGKLDAGDAAGVFRFGENHPVGADALQGFAMQIVGGAGDDHRHGQAFQQHGHPHAGLHVVAAQGDYGDVVMGQVQFPQRGLVGGIGADGVGDLPRLRLDPGFIGVDGKDVVSALVQLAGHSGAETAHPDDANLLFHPAPLLSIRMYKACGPGFGIRLI